MQLSDLFAERIQKLNYFSETQLNTTEFFLDDSEDKSSILRTLWVLNVISFIFWRLVN